MPDLTFESHYALIDLLTSEFYGYLRLSSMRCVTKCAASSLVEGYLLSCPHLLKTSYSLVAQPSSLVFAVVRVCASEILRAIA
jgi:hypothetical protein